MLIIPAIDLLNGKCVRLTEGDFNTQKIYYDDPVEWAMELKYLGAKRLHIIDLDGAKTGSLINKEIIKNIKKKTNLKIQLGGGLRREEDIKDLIFFGIDYLILGTILIENIDKVKEWVDSYGDYFLAAIDVKDNNVYSHGWQEKENINIIDFGKKIFNIGIKEAIYTDISKDGKLIGPNIEDAKKFSNATGLRVIISGGISSMEDIKQVKTLVYYGLTGIIIGKAMYEGNIDIKQAIKKFQD